MLKKWGNEAYPSFTGQPKELSFYGKDAPLRRETVPGLSPFVPSSIPILDGEDGGLKCPIKSSKLIYQLGRLLGVL